MPGKVDLLVGPLCPVELGIFLKDFFIFFLLGISEYKILITKCGTDS